MSIKIVIDAGHGGYDNGASFKGRNEKTDTINLSFKVKSILEKHFIDVFLTRSNDSFVSLENRAKYENDIKPNLFISIHRNDATSDTACGFEVFSLNSTGVGRTLSENINSEVKSLKIFVDRGCKTANFYVLRNTIAPAALCEVGFMKTDNKIFDDNFDKIAIAISKGILKTLNIPYKEEVKIPEKIDTGFYRVVVGSYKNKDLAIKKQEELKAKNEESFLVFYEK